MSLTDDILIILTSYSGGYKKMRDIMLGRTYPEHGREINENTLRTTLYRLKNKGLVVKNGFIWNITKEGRKFIQDGNRKLPHLNYANLSKRRMENMIVAFDIPETNKKKRGWLRFELMNLGFKPIQKSVWFGPSPLPEEFIKSLDDLKILGCLKFFKVSKEDLI